MPNSSITLLILLAITITPFTQAETIKLSPHHLPPQQNNSHSDHEDSLSKLNARIHNLQAELQGLKEQLSLHEAQSCQQPRQQNKIIDRPLNQPKQADAQNIEQKQHPVETQIYVQQNSNPKQNVENNLNTQAESTKRASFEENNSSQINPESNNIREQQKSNNEVEKQEVFSQKTKLDALQILNSPKDQPEASSNSSDSLTNNQVQKQYIPSICMPICDFDSDYPICDHQACRACKSDSQCVSQVSTFEAHPNDYSVFCEIASGKCIQKPDF